MSSISVNILNRFPLEIHEQIASYLDDNSALRMRVAALGAEHLTNKALAIAYGFTYGKPLIEKEIVNLSLLETGSFRGIPERISKKLILEIAYHNKNQLHAINLIWDNQQRKKLELAEINSILSQIPNLHSLILSECKDNQANATPQWPASLETLVLDSFGNLNENWMKSLPGHLKSLVLKNSHFHPANIRLLPRQLTSFIVLGPMEIGRQFISCLPDSLATLIVKNNSDWEDKDIGFLPQGLMILALNSEAKLTGQCFSRLPRSLTKLNLNSCTSLTKENVATLPRNLKSFELSSVFPKDGISFLPPSLIDLCLSFSLIGGPVPYEAFPKELKSLRCSSVYFTNKSISLLPTTLTRLQFIDSIVDSWEDEVKFPPNLIEVDVTHLDVDEMHLAKIVSNDVMLFIQALPSTITMLNLSKTRLFLPSILMLLENLTTLNLSESEFSSSVSFLPENLTALNLSGIQNKITNLPQGLKILDLTGRRLTIEELNLLPRGLTSLNLFETYFDDEDLGQEDLEGSGDITNRCIPHLPKSLTEIGLSEDQELQELDVEEIKKAFPEMNFVWQLN